MIHVDSWIVVLSSYRKARFTKCNKPTLTTRSPLTMTAFILNKSRLCPDNPGTFPRRFDKTNAETERFIWHMHCAKPRSRFEGALSFEIIHNNIKLFIRSNGSHDTKHASSERNDRFWQSDKRK